LKVPKRVEMKTVFHPVEFGSRISSKASYRKDLPAE
jgi:hypothetical protein